MSNFKFTCTDVDGSVNTYEFTAESITNVVQHFEQFLRGSGFHFDGHLDLCNITEPANNWEQEPDYVPPPNPYGQYDRCKVCGLTREQLGSHNCYDKNCGLQ